MKKRILSMALSLVFIGLLACSPLAGSFAVSARAEGAVEIGTAEALKTIRLDGSYRLSADIVLEQEDNWTPIGSMESPFTGTLDGDGHKISGLDLNADDDDFSGLFGYIGETGTVRNLTVEDVFVKNNGCSGLQLCGGIAGYNKGTITGCLVTVKTLYSNFYTAGGIAGFNSGTISDCTVQLAKDAGEAEQQIYGYVYAGGIVGRDEAGSIIGCRAEGLSILADSDESRVGGIAGCSWKGTRIENCTVTNMTLSAEGRTGSAGGISGWNRGTISDCSNTGAVLSGNYCGGIVGYNDIGGEVFACFNAATVTYGNSAGGVVGHNAQSVHDCYNLGAVSGGSTGGVAGTVSGEVKNCFNYAALSDGGVGGVVGKIRDDGAVSGCYYLKTAEINATISGVGTETEDAAGVAEALSAEQFKNAESFVGWNFRNRWVLDSNAGMLYPEIGWVVSFDLAGDSEAPVDWKAFRKSENGVQTQLPDLAALGIAAPPGKMLEAWTLNGETYAPGTAYTVKGHATFTAKWLEISVQGGWSNGKLVATVTLPANANAVLIAASYDGKGRQVGVKVIKIEADQTVYETGLAKKTGYTYKLMLVDKTTYAPLCAAWGKKA